MNSKWKSVGEITTQNLRNADSFRILWEFGKSHEKMPTSGCIADLSFTFSCFEYLIISGQVKGPPWIEYYGNNYYFERLH